MEQARFPLEMTVEYRQLQTMERARILRNSLTHLVRLITRSLELGINQHLGVVGRVWLQQMGNQQQQMCKCIGVKET